MRLLKYTIACILPAAMSTTFEVVAISCGDLRISPCSEKVTVGEPFTLMVRSPLAPVFYVIGVPPPFKMRYSVAINGVTVIPSSLSDYG